MAMTSEPPPPSYDSLTPYHRNGNPFDDNEKLPASVQLSRATPLDHADSSTPILQADRFLIPSATAHNLSFSSIPPPTLSHLIPAYEWAAFTTSLSAATALSSGQKAKVIAAGLASGKAPVDMILAGSPTIRIGVSDMEADTRDADGGEADVSSQVQEPAGKGRN
ncbi:MAG: hypothetical protein Q9202_000414 [Teloschistes flavicans]